jgi:hypothetical protein
MTNRPETTILRHLSCCRCGTEFTCSLSAQCWCAKEAARLPMPVESDDCLCRDCLRQLAGTDAG